jgi:hypothetical protein
MNDDHMLMVCAQDCLYPHYQRPRLHGDLHFLGVGYRFWPDRPVHGDRGAVQASSPQAPAREGEGEEGGEAGAGWTAVHDGEHCGPERLCSAIGS